MKNYTVYLKVRELIKIYSPPRDVFHAIVFLYAFKYKLFPEARRWEWELFSPFADAPIYSPTLDRLLQALIRSGRIKLCKCNILSVDKCPEIYDCTEYYDSYLEKFEKTIKAAMILASKYVGVLP